MVEEKEGGNWLSQLLVTCMKQVLQHPVLVVMEPAMPTNLANAGSPIVCLNPLQVIAVKLCTAHAAGDHGVGWSRN